ncbi:M43 family zinc metalloprotease [Flavihumibacter petaseus]|uniref:Peptidase M43 family protein n=1 Tax=Flavihumibacter petaseus NBRC 106054 TaxID=1220578 RepID=A0A0E9N2Q2_9BACT|nr:M43 family zinc metalloprotease [Flavihumibacter petaseus]GAO44287.1 peptidase M43 family protein [Flavihumibacter petaseus NBRC 106054]
MRRIIFLSLICLIGLAPALPAQEKRSSITIPVVVHILYSDATSRVTEERVHDQIEALNRDFNAENVELAQLPDYFKQVAGNASISFQLAKTDPGGNSTSGIVYKATGIGVFSTDNRIKFSNKGGDDAWPRDHYLNIWVGNLIGGISGYTSSPDDAAELDGIVLNRSVFGNGINNPEHNMGRIAVHEAGHWLGLKHIWGDSYCGDDGIDDTPKQKSYHLGCPQGQIFSCEGNTTGDMYMNYMDRTNDHCMSLFTRGQVARMRSLFEPGQLRHPLLSSGGLVNDGTPIEPGWQADKVQPVVATIGMKAYPVPANDVLKITITGKDQAALKDLTIFNMMGQPVMVAQMKGGTAQLDVSRLQKGQYVVKGDQPGVRPLIFTKL